MAVEPPLVESVIDEGSDRSVVVRVRLGGDVESVHARVEDRCGGSVCDRFAEEGDMGLQAWARTCPTPTARREKRARVNIMIVGEGMDQPGETLLASGRRRRRDVERTRTSFPFIFSLSLSRPLTLSYGQCGTIVLAPNSS